MKLLITKGTTSKRQGIFIQDSSSSVGAGLTALLFNSAGLTWHFWRENEGNVGATSVTLATATRGTYASGGFIEKDATNMPGLYEIGIPDAALATGANWVIAVLKGAANMAPLVLEIQLINLDLEDGVRAGLSALPNAAAEAAGGLYTRGSGAGQINQDTNGQIDVDVIQASGVLAERAQGLPPITPTIDDVLMYLYMVLRNDSQSTATERRILNNAGIVIAKATLSDDTTTFRQGQMVTGP